MTKIAINLLPEEFRKEELKRAKFYKIQSIGVATILFMIFLASLTVALRVLQSNEIQNVKNGLTKSEQRISDLKTSQSKLTLLKNRLTTINEYLGVSSKQVQMYNLMGKIIPASVSINLISVDKNGETLILAQAPDGGSIDNLITSLTQGETNQDKITSVSIESLNRSKDGIYRISFKVKPK